jgi:transcription initiation factor TFIIIB Brf1 subunit/transcription initiation factor TFIIB
MNIKLIDYNEDNHIDEIINDDNINDINDINEYLDKKSKKNKNKSNKSNKSKNKVIISEFDSIDIEDYDKYNDLMNSIYLDDDIIEKPIIKNTNKVKRNLFCDACNSDDIVEDTSHGIVVCRGCGQVLSNMLDLNAEWTQYNDDNKKDMNRCSHPINQLLPQSSIATTITGTCSSRIKTLHGWSAMPYKERSLNEVFKIITAKCHEGKILKCIEDDAKIMYKNISDCKHLYGKNKDKSIIIRGKNRTSVIAGCILFACRKKDKTRSPKEIAELFNLKYTEITKGCKIFQRLAKLKNMDLHLKFTKPENFITRFCEELKIKNEYAIQAIQISNNVQKLQIASVHTPLSLATGSIYLMIHLNKLDIQKKTIAEKFNVSQVTIAKAFKKLEPFINILVNNDICDRLSVEIKKYQDDIIITDALKPKFIRFNIDTNKMLKKDHEIIYSVVNNKDNKIIINEKLIVEQNIEFENKNYQIDNEYIRLKLENVDLIFKELNLN